MEKRRTKEWSRTRSKRFYCHHHLCHLLVFLFCSSISTRISTCSSVIGSTARTVQSLDNLRNRLRILSERRRDTTTSFGFYYGIPRTIIESFIANQGVSDSDTIVKENDDDDDVSLAKRRYLDGYESIGRDVEKWAEGMLRNEGSDNVNSILNVENKNGWTEIFCAKVLRSKFNSGNNSTVPITRQWVKWMKDSREQYANLDDDQNHPCMKLVATIDAPFPIVCRYLSEKDRFQEYNSLLVDQEDVEILTPHSKICWSQSKKLPLIQPRDFVTYCRHRWLNDGTQLISNQACDHPRTIQKLSDTNINSTLSSGSGYRAFSLRGATYISRCPDFPNERTKLVMLSHCNCGRDIPEWVVRTAVGLSAPIKPFEIIHRIDVGIRLAREELERAVIKPTATSTTTATTTTTTTTVHPERSSQPAGIAQMGYACFWPEGGGLVDGSNQ